MDEIEVVIRIPEEWIEQFKAFKHPSTLETIILQGTVLPKGHSRLIDASQLFTVTECRPDGTEFTYVPYTSIENAEAVIEADKEVENG